MSDNELLKAALDYAGRGWPVFPCKKGGKTPLVKRGVIEATTDKSQIKQWWGEDFPGANIGLHVWGAGMIALDYDTGYDYDGLVETLGREMPETGLSQRTPSGGMHELFKLPTDEPVPQSISKLAHKIDVRCFHSYILLAPSHTEKGDYEWLEESGPATAPLALITKARECGSVRRDDWDEWIIASDDPIHIDKAIDWLKHKAKPAIEGEAGDNATYSAAAMCRSFGISEDKAFDLMIEHYNPRCVPPWDDSGIMGKVKHAYTYATSPPGNCTDKFHIERGRRLFDRHKKAAGVETAELDVQYGRYRFFRREDLDNIPLPTWVVDDFIQKGTHVNLFGASQSYKTFVALDLAMAIATGNSETWGIEETGDVLFAAGEGVMNFKKRVIAWERKWNKGKPVDGFNLCDPVPGIRREDYVDFATGAFEMYDTDRFKLLVIDTIGRSMTGHSTDDQKDVGLFSEMISFFLNNLCDVVLSIGHTNHSDPNRIAGSKVFFNDVDTSVRVESTQDLTTTLTMDKQKDAPRWRRPIYMTLEKVAVEEDISGDNSLVVVPAKEPAKIQKIDKRSTLFNRIDMTMAYVMSRRKNTEYSVSQICDLIAHYLGDITPKETARCLEQMRALRCYRTRDFWSPDSRRFRYREPGSVD